MINNEKYFPFFFLYKKKKRKQYKIPKNLFDKSQKYAFDKIKFYWFIYMLKALNAENYSCKNKLIWKIIVISNNSLLYLLLNNF